MALDLATGMAGRTRRAQPKFTLRQIAASIRGLSGGASELVWKGTELMKNGQVALALAGGYLLGRYHKMRWALALAGAAAGKRAAGVATGKQLGRASGLLQSPEVGRLAKDIRGDLLAAGRSAAVAAVGTRINDLSDRMEERAASLREPSGDEAEGDEGEEATSRGERKARRSGSAKSRRASTTRAKAEVGSSKASGSARESTKPGSRTKKPTREGTSGGRSGKRAASADRPTGRSRG
ncbi:hypothetical protein [Streptomyces silvisoli]|uniref:DUF2892 domain-containing protein n=1 Tax=Streptomyces silvisoli TaxID=3034235 RepID=A0ABT5ZT64_9ACTN|nr:hypothetical protein [Streptomyces silvisoli]MDF3293028.1 hypothetical protein [Streptomyces silvisoli]